MERLPALPLAIFFVIAAIVFYWLSRYQKQKTGLPAGRIIFTDTQGWLRVERPLYDPDLKLTGKPDYIIEQNGQIIPVEVKSSCRLTAPHDAHLYQLGAYCLLVDRVYGKRPDYGILHYPDKTFAVDFTQALEAEVLALVVEMQSYTESKSLDRSHDSPQRCVHCGYRSICDQSLRI